MKDYPIVKISCVMPILNGVAYLERAIDSFLHQDYPHKELVIVDGRSTDGSHSIIREYVANYPSTIQWIREEDCGLSHARNIGVGYCKGDFIGFLGSDDVLLQGIYTRIGELAKWVSFDGVFFGCLCHPLDKGAIATNLKKRFCKKTLLNTNFTAGECFYYKQKIFKEFLFDEKNKASMDYEFNLRLAFNSNFKFIPINESYLIAFMHKSSVSNLYKKEQREETKQMRKRYSRIYRKERILKGIRRFISYIRFSF